MHANDTLPDSKILRVARAGGIEPRRKGTKIVGLCPFHNDHSPSLALNPDLDSFKCWVCAEHGGYLKLAKKLNVDLDAVLPREQASASSSTARPATPPPLRVVTPEPERTPPVTVPDLPRVTNDPETLAYLERRRLLEAMRLGLMVFATPELPVIQTTTRGPVPAFAMGYRMGAPLLDANGRMSGAQLRRISATEPSFRFHSLGSGSFGDRSQLADAKICVIAEGLVDYLHLSVYSAHMDKVPVIGIPGTATIASLLSGVKFCQHVRVAACFDGDRAGDQAVAQLRSVLARRGARIRRCRPLIEEAR